MSTLAEPGGSAWHFCDLTQKSHWLLLPYCISQGILEARTDFRGRSKEEAVLSAGVARF